MAIGGSSFKVQVLHEQGIYKDKAQEDHRALLLFREGLGEWVCPTPNSETLSLVSQEYFLRLSAIKFGLRDTGTVQRQSWLSR